MKNEYEVRGDVTAIFINSSKHGRLETLISTDKLNKAEEFPNTWNVVLDPHSQCFYVLSSIRKNGKKATVYLHRWITNAPKGLVVDHINHNTLNNTDSNLRIITHAENLQNRKSATSHNTSGIRGVHRDKKKWKAMIIISGERMHLGMFDDIHDAERTVIEARMKYMPYSSEASL